MIDYIILTDTCSDLDSKTLKEIECEMVKTHIFIDDKDYLCDNDWLTFSSKEFYDMIRNKKRIKTSQVDSFQFLDVFRKYNEHNIGVIYIATSSALSNCLNEARRAKEEILKENEKARIEIIDSLNACYSLGMLVIKACKLRKDGYSYEQLIEWIVNNKFKFNESGSVGDLTYLRNAGRISGTAAFFGGLLALKPIIVLNEHGQNNAFEKVKGRKASYKRSAEIIRDNIDIDFDDNIHICHADCEDDVKEFASILLNLLGDKKVNLHYHIIDPTIGASVGPGTFIVNFASKEELRYIK